MPRPGPLGRFPARTPASLCPPVQPTCTAHGAHILSHPAMCVLQQVARPGSASSTSSEIEDWELWGDPREIERRRAERARAKVPAEQRKAQVWGARWVGGFRV
jgi:hypothetical protein